MGKVPGWGMLLALLLPLAASAEKPLPTYELEAKGKIAIGPDGSVRDYALESKLAPQVAAIVDRRVREWKFEPILVDGKPVIGETTMRLALLAVPQDAERYALRIENVWFGEPERAHQMKPPKYPAEAVRAGISAKVVLVLKLDAQGNVVDLVSEQTSLSASGNARVEKQWREVFENASAAAARKWRFDTAERINGEPVGSVVRVPVTYTLSFGRGDADKWTAFIPGPVRPVPWVGPETVASQEDRDRLRDGDMQPLDSRFRLKDEIVGTTL